MNILDLMDKYDLELTQQGDLFVTFCPFHRDENRPNFTVYPKTDSYFCYTCGEGGNAIHFFSRMENITYEQARQKLFSDVSYLLERLNKPPEEKYYNEMANLQISKIIHIFLTGHKELLSQVKEIMKEVDDKLVR